jgi:hypothetical protein
MKVVYKDSLNFKLRERIREIDGPVVMFSDLADLSGKTQISRALKILVNAGELVRIGYGIYAKSFVSPYLDKPVIKGGFQEAALTALNRLGIKWELGKLTKDYNSSASTQVPVRPPIKLKSQLRRQIGCDGMILHYE